MKTQYITKYVNEYGQIDIFGLLKRIGFLYRDSKFDEKQLTRADKMINELYEIYTGTEYDNINHDLFVLGFDDECEMYRLITGISNKLYSIDYNKRHNVSRETL